MNNYTNVIKYKLLAPVYDIFVGNHMFIEGRRKGFALLRFQPDDNVLLIGLGTGQDLPFLPDGINVVGIDISEAMLAKAEKRAKGRNIRLLNMNAEKLEFKDETFDTVVLNLILSVVEYPHKAMSEAVRVLKRDGRILVFDKFLEGNKNPSLFRRLLNSVTSLLGTDINRRFRDILDGLPVTVIYDMPLMFTGNYRVIFLKKINIQ